MRLAYIIGGGFISIGLCYLILMVLSGLGAGGGLLELMSLFLLMALPGIIAGTAAAVGEKREKELSELKEELTAIRALLEKQDRQ